MAKNNVEPTKTKFKFGRNPLSFIIVVVSLAIIIFGVVTISSYVNAWNNNKVTPFVTSSADENTDTTYKSSLPTSFSLSEESDYYEIIRMNGKDFDMFDFTCKCTEYGANTNGSATFAFTIKWNEKTSENYTVLKDIDTNQKNIQFAFCLASDWVGFCKYASSLTKYKISSSDSEAISFSKSITGVGDFPLTTSTFPVPVKIYTPNLYVCITYMYENNGTRTKNYILQYTYDEYHIDGETIGGYKK